MSLLPRISVHILLPESIDRRFRRRVANLPGASWPAWGGHITLVPSFVPTCPPEQVFDLVAEAVKSFTAFRVRLAEAVVDEDVTRPDYHAVFIQVEDPESEDHQTLVRLQQAIFHALELVRNATVPELDTIPFTPHLTLALAVGYAEAREIVNTLRSEPLEVEFMVDAVWLVLMWQEEGREPHTDRVPIRLAKLPKPPEALPPGTLSD